MARDLLGGAARRNAREPYYAEKVTSAGPRERSAAPAAPESTSSAEPIAPAHARDSAARATLRQPGRTEAENHEQEHHHVRAAELELTPAVLEVTDAELGFVAEVAPLLSAAPRVLKRFVNTYRLFKATQSDDLTREVPGVLPDFQVSMLLLSVLVGMPVLSRQLQVHSVGPGDATLVRVLEETIADPKLSERPLELDEAKQVLDWLCKRDEVWTSLRFSAVKAWISRVGRYTFNFRRTY